MTNFRVSVLIPVYNAGKYVEQAVKSALALSETAEIILVDDSSRDNSYEICERLDSKYDIVKLYQSPGDGNLGAGPTRNYAISQANFPYVSFLDADDYYLEDRFANTKNVFDSNPDANGVYECVGIHFENKEAKASWMKQGRKFLTTMEEGIDPSNLFSELLSGTKGYFHLNGLTLKRNSIDTYFSELELTQDTLFMMMLSATKKLYPGELANPVAIRRVHDDNRHTKSYQKLFQYQLKCFETLLKWLHENQQNHGEIQLVKRLIFNAKIELSMYEGFNRKKQIQAELIKESFSQRSILFSKYSVKALLAAIGILNLVRSTVQTQ